VEAAIKLRKRLEENNSKAMRDLFGVTKQNRILNKILSKNLRKGYRLPDENPHQNWDNPNVQLHMFVSYLLLSNLN